MKVTIEEGCIACSACESICEEVFTVEDSCTADNSHVSGNEELCREAAEACPVDVIIIEE